MTAATAGSHTSARVATATARTTAHAGTPPAATAAAPRPCNAAHAAAHKPQPRDVASTRRPRQPRTDANHHLRGHVPRWQRPHGLPKPLWHAWRRCPQQPRWPHVPPPRPRMQLYMDTHTAAASISAAAATTTASPPHIPALNTAGRTEATASRRREYVWRHNEISIIIVTAQ